ncbi:sulfite exporter TauE/SafE family protein [Paenibacillus sp.]|uniref:sulfite exporter TauE/SafE family protein n=1 Tax=Paenibacillus sp. TaxID=58172 RepID=UPI0028124F57|nr:sulfite exporter TauE/SafE family protein [Paenibacillus sp.]
MRRLVLFSLVGFFAQLVDGSLGMGFGATSGSLLLMFGVAPAVVSASIHLAEVGTTAASGASHLYFKNVDRRLAWRLLIPGAIAAFLGAAFLSSLPGHLLKPFIAAFLTALGVYILIRFLLQARRRQDEPEQQPAYSKTFVIPLAIVGGFFDAVGGGGWGPITTPALLAKNGATPRKVVGTVATSEFAVAVSATLGFVLFLGWEAFNLFWVLAFVLGGVFAAPLAAYLVKVIPTQYMGVTVGGFIILTNLNTLLQSADFVPSEWTVPIYIVVFVLWISAVVYQWSSRRRVANA